MSAGPEPDIWGNLTVCSYDENGNRVCVSAAELDHDYGGHFVPLGAPPGECELPYPPVVPVLVRPRPGSTPNVVECNCDE